MLISLIGSPRWDGLENACLIAAQSLPSLRLCRRCCPALLSTSPSETRPPRSLFLEAARGDQWLEGAPALPRLRSPLSCAVGTACAAHGAPGGDSVGEGFLVFKHFTLNFRNTTCVKADLLTAAVFTVLGFRIVLKP